MWNDKSTSFTPVMLTTAVMIFALLRIGVWFGETFYTHERGGIKWEDASRADLADGRTYQTKMLFYYFCEKDSEACRKVDRGALFNKQVVESINSNFLPIKVLNKPDIEGIEKGNLSQELQQKFGVFMCPAFVISLSDGREVGRMPGYFSVSANNLLSFIKYSERREKYISGLDYLAHAQYDRSARSFKVWLQARDKNDPRAIDAILYCALAYKMIFEENRANEVLAMINNEHYEKNTDWPRPLVLFLSGKLSAQELWQKCHHQEGNQSKASYFIGMLSLRNGDIQDAVANFKQAEKAIELSPEVHELVTGQLNMIFGQKN